MSKYSKKPATVKYIGAANKYMDTNGTKPLFTVGAIYEAYFLEYWEGVRDAIHVMCDDGEIRYFIHFDDFEVISDEDGVLNYNEAIVRCTTHAYDDNIMDLTYGKEYCAIGRDKDGYYLVKDESYCCYFYEASCFDIVSDPNGVLKEQSVYYSFWGDREPADHEEDYYKAHEFSRNHRAQLEKDSVCGCFDCLRIFSPKEIVEWVPETMDGDEVTAICPYCGTDSIIGESSGFPITKELLKDMNFRWFM